MEHSSESPADEVARLRRRLDDVGRITALPALSSGGEPREILGALVHALHETLRPAFVFVRLAGPDGGAPVEVVRVNSAPERVPTARDLGALLDRALGPAPSRWPPSARVSVGGDELCVAVARLGIHGELGTVVAGSRRPDFPEQVERLLLDVAANQAAVGVQRARLLGEQARLARVLDEHVSQRTSDLAAANEALTAEVLERRRTEEALRESERESRRIVDSIPGLAALLTATGEVEVVNHRLTEYFGQTLEELREWGTNGTVHPEDLPHVAGTFTRSVATGSPYRILQRFRRSDGVYRWFENSGSPIRDAHGRITRWCVLLTDIDERKRAEDALAASERNLQLIIDAMPALAWSTTPDGAADFFNRHYLDYVGLSAERASGWGWTAAVHPEDIGSLADTWQRCLRDGVAGEAEARLRRHDGAYRWFLFRASPLRDASGAIVKWYGVNADIEDRKRAEAELRRTYTYLAEGQRLSRCGSFFTDFTAEERVWSDELFRILELDPATSVTGRLFRSMVHPEDLPLYDAQFARLAAGHNLETAFRIVTAGGAVKHVRSVCHIVDWHDGRPVCFGAVQDVTETVVAQEALDRARAELAHVARASTLGALTASIAHEVNQPLSGIITNAGTCLRMLDADPPNLDGARETARRTIRDGRRAADVITRLRALFTRREFTLEPLDLNEAVGEVVALSLRDLQRSRVALRSELAEGLPPVVGDRVQLQQVILNLLLNAAEAMREVDDRGRELTIRTEREGDAGVRVTVRDSGVGVDRQSRDRVFDAFYTTKRGGMGIGLSVSRSIIERHHGRLWVEPNDGPGATFAFSIPCGPAGGGDGGATDTKV